MRKRWKGPRAWRNCDISNDFSAFGSLGSSVTWRYFILNLPNHPLFWTQFVTKPRKKLCWSSVIYKEGLYEIQGKRDQNLSYKARFKIAGRSFLKLPDRDSTEFEFLCDSTHTSCESPHSITFSRLEANIFRKFRISNFRPPPRAGHSTGLTNGRDDGVSHVSWSYTCFNPRSPPNAVSLGIGSSGGDSVDRFRRQFPWGKDTSVRPLPRAAVTIKGLGTWNLQDRGDFCGNIARRSKAMQRVVLSLIPPWIITKLLNFFCEKFCSPLERYNLWAN